MPQKYRIYINDNSLIIGEYPVEGVKEFQRLDSQNFDFPTFYKNLKGKQGMHFQIVTTEPKRIYKRIKKSCQIIKAAGGLVKNEAGAYLCIFRHKKWDLPKGKVEKSEKVKAAAVREVEEECGVHIHKVGKKLESTYHTYVMDGHLVLKKTVWYAMKVKDIPKLVPQTAEGITRAEWIEPDKVRAKMANTFPLIREVLVAANL